MICKRRNKRKHTTHPCRQNGLLSSLMNFKSLTWVFCTCFSLNSPFPENISLTLMSSISVLPVLRRDLENSSLEGPTSQLCNLPPLFCISWCLGPNVLLASTFPLDFKEQLWLDGWYFGPLIIWNQEYSTVWVTSNHDNNNDDEIITMQIRMLMSAHTYRICSVPVLIAAHMWTHRSIRITLWGCYYKPHFTKKEMTQRAENSHTIPIPLSHSDSRG